jgi:hypothetical protein
MIAKIYYSLFTDPRDDEWWYLNIYKRVHYDEDDSPIIIPTAKFSHYWKLMTTYGTDGEVEAVLNRMFALFNDGLDIPNPLGTPEGQVKVKQSGTHHTSMSVGDVIGLKDKLWIVAGVGFRELRLK